MPYKISVRAKREVCTYISSRTGLKLLDFAYKAQQNADDEKPLGSSPEEAQRLLGVARTQAKKCAVQIKAKIEEHTPVGNGVNDLFELADYGMQPFVDACKEHIDMVDGWLHSNDNFLMHEKVDSLLQEFCIEFML